MLSFRFIIAYLLEGTIRTFDTAIREDVKAKFYTIVEAVAAAFSQEVEIEWFPGPPPLINDKTVTEIARNSAKQQSLLVMDPELSMAGEDFAYYLNNIPGTFAFLVQTGMRSGTILHLLLMNQLL